jgi:archaeosortase B (VPXXXP-CTERM-specific)
MTKKVKSASLTERILSQAHKNREIIKFFILFVIYTAAFFGLYILVTVYSKGTIDALNAFTARSIQITASLIGLEASTASTSLTVKGFSIKVIVECTGLFAAFVLLACVLAYPTSFAKKIIGMSAGIIVIYFLNIIRMLFLIFIGIWAPKYFDFVHVYLWEGVFIIVVVLLWMIWLDKVVKHVR